MLEAAVVAREKMFDSNGVLFGGANGSMHLELALFFGGGLNLVKWQH